MRARLYAFAMGLLFAVGLVVSGMTNPDNIKGFLDLFGQWRPQLLGVLGAAVIVTSGLYAFARRKPASLPARSLHWPEATQIDRPLIVGSILFGTGWALSGYCPGPALVNLGALHLDALVFVAAMWGGSWLNRKTGGT